MKAPAATSRRLSDSSSFAWPDDVMVPPDDYGEGGAVYAPERRNEPRQATLGQAWISRPTPDPRLAHNPYDRREVTSVNLSRHGIAFLSDHPLPPGSYYRIELTVAHHTAAVEIRVAHCRRLDGQYEVGGELF